MFLISCLGWGSRVLAQDYKSLNSKVHILKSRHHRIWGYNDDSGKLESLVLLSDVTSKYDKYGKLLSILGTPRFRSTLLDFSGDQGTGVIARDIIKNSYDSNGMLRTELRFIDFKNAWDSSTFTYYPSGQLLSKQSILNDGKNGDWEVYEYDCAGNCIYERVLHSKSESIRIYEYSSTNKLLQQEKTWNGKYNSISRYYYDENDSLIKSVYEGEGNVITDTSIYTAGFIQKELVIKNDTIFSRVEYLYDSLNHLVERVSYDGKDSVSERHKYTYDNKGNRVRSWDYRTIHHREELEMSSKFDAQGFLIETSGYTDGRLRYLTLYDTLCQKADYYGKWQNSK